MSDYSKIVSAIKSSAKDDLSSEQQKLILKALPELKKAYEKVQAGSGRMKGRGFWDWLSTAAGDVNNWLKENKVLSKIAKPVLEYILPVAAGVLGTPLSGAAVGVAGLAATEGLKALGYGKRKTMGGMAMLTISPIGQRLRGRGMTMSRNGSFQKNPIGGKYMMGCGNTAFGAVSSEFGKIKV